VVVTVEPDDLANPLSFPGRKPPLGDSSNLATLAECASPDLELTSWRGQADAQTLTAGHDFGAARSQRRVSRVVYVAPSLLANDTPWCSNFQITACHDALVPDQGRGSVQAERSGSAWA
jgi:hypothetical protein